MSFNPDTRRSPLFSKKAECIGPGLAFATAPIAIFGTIGVPVTESIATVSYLLVFCGYILFGMMHEYANRAVLFENSVDAPKGILNRESLALSELTQCLRMLYFVTLRLSSLSSQRNSWHAQWPGIKGGWKSLKARRTIVKIWITGSIDTKRKTFCERLPRNSSRNR